MPLGKRVESLYIFLAAFHLILVVLTGFLWAWLLIRPQTLLASYHHEVRAVHFGSLYLFPQFLGLGWALNYLQVTPIHWLAFPLGLGWLLLFSTIAYYLPRSPGVPQYRYWTKGLPMGVAMVGMVGFAGCLLWLAAVLIAKVL